MKKLLFIISLLAFLSPVKADEGMWLITMLQKLQLEQKGSKLSAEQIYSINNSSVKDAIVGLGESDRPFNFFCTSELVSSKGLVFTNYHCGFEMIQKHTSITNNYIENGFWAKNQQEELPNEGITASIVYKMIDVSDKIMPLYALGITDAEKLADTIAKISAIITQSVSDTSSYFGSVKGFFENNQYFLFVYEKFQDVRLVGAPPRSIGKFGGDTDNWMWPRHTGDFCVLRIYGNSYSKPAIFSQSNTPITPKHFLPVSIKRLQKNDFAFVMGFPGSTDRYKTSYGIEGLYKFNNKSIIEIGDKMLAIYKQYMNSDPTIKIKYAAKYDQMSNYWKYAIGQNQGIVALNVIKEKVKQEEVLIEWIEADDERKARYGKMIDEIENFYAESNEAKMAANYMNQGLLNAPEIFMFTYNCIEFLEALSSNDPVLIKEQTIKMKEKIAAHFKNYDKNVDIAQFVAMSELYKSKVPLAYHPYYFATVDKKFKGDFKKFADKLYNKTMFADEIKMLAFLEKPNSKKFLKDPAFDLLRKTFPAYFLIQSLTESTKFDAANQLYVEAVMKQNPDSVFYPDANSTLRYTYGYVSDYATPEGKQFSHVTYLDELIAKEDVLNEEFEVAPQLKELYNTKNYGVYADKTGKLPVCFITNNDITGGNSGSPVMNAKGELIGIAFDGNWEAMSGDIIFEPKVQKCISVDIRYVLFIIDKFAGAGYLLDEMTISK